MDPKDGKNSGIVCRGRVCSWHDGLKYFWIGSGESAIIKIIKINPLKIKNL